MIDEKIEAIIFDFGGVIINIDYNATIQAFKDLGITDFEGLYSQAAQSDLFNDIETGRISAQQFINGLLQLLPSGTTTHQVVRAWNAMILDIPSERIDLLLSLKNKYQIYLLSNTNSLHIEDALRKWNIVSDRTIDTIFDHVYLSHEMGMRKPDLEIFESVCNEQGLNLETTLFIDDSIQHIDGANKLGLNTYHLKEGTELHDVFS